MGGRDAIPEQGTGEFVGRNSPRPTNFFSDGCSHQPILFPHLRRPIDQSGGIGLWQTSTNTSTSTMVSSFCWGCLSRLRPTPRALLPPTPTAPRALSAGFHTTTARYAAKKKAGGDSGPKYREAKSAKMKKKKPVDRPRPPPVGERKALRKRIVLSNPNALEVEGMPDLSAENMADSRLRASVAGLPVSMLDQLRAVQAFQTKQGWSIFRRPGTVMRTESVVMGRLFDSISGDSEGKGQVVKKIVSGVKGAGKSVHLLQAMAMGFLKNWVVFTVPDSKFFFLVWSAFCISFTVTDDLFSPGIG